MSLSTQQSNAPADHPPLLLPTDDVHVTATQSLISPQQAKQQRPLTARAHQTVVEDRQVVENILSGLDKRCLLIVGPCSIHDPKAALDYAQRLTALKPAIEDQIYPIMRVYFEKPRTTVGWKGLINDPHLDGSFDIQAGLLLARSILVQINELGLGTATEMLEPITPQYIADLISWTAIGARTTESQTHRQMASGLSMPVGYKNATNGNLQIAIDAMMSATSAHSFLGIDQQGSTAIIQTSGNPQSHLILRGGSDRTNYDAPSVTHAAQQVKQAGLRPGVMVDCSHANSFKQFEKQQIVWQDIIDQRCQGNSPIVGIMIESNISQGNQAMGDDPTQLRYGVSVTDACLGWEDTEKILLEGAKRLADTSARRGAM